MAAIAAMVIIGIVGTLAVRSISELVESRRQVDRSYAVMQALDRLLISLDDTETGQRGFIITGDSAFLEPHIEGVVQARDIIAQLRILMTSDPAQRRALERLVEAADHRIEHAQGAVMTMATEGPAAARSVVVGGQGRRTMDAVRSLVATMQARETQLLEDRRASAERSLVGAGMVSALGILTAAALAVIAIILMRKTVVALDQGRRSASYARTLMDAASDGIYGLDSRGHITFANRSMATALGYEVAELMGKHGHSLFHHTRLDGSPYPVEECAIYKALTGEFSGKIDDEIIWKRDGTFLPVEYSVAKVSDPQGAPGAVISFRDITERQVAENALHSARELAEASNRAKSDFLARMSHELRTPLNSVIGFSNLLLRNKSGGINAKEISYLERIHKNGVSLLALINDILDLSKIEAGRMEVEFAPADLGEIVRDVVATFETQVMGRPLHLGWTVPDDLPPITTDAGPLRQVLSNLVGNAIKFTQAGTVHVTVTTNPETGTAALIEVSDSGIGIPPDRMTAIFDDFEQAERSTTRRFGGTGLGLPISKSLCALMGYDLRAISDPGRGSTFVVDLDPATSPEATAAMVYPEAVDAADNAVLRGKVVLIVDDALDDRLLIANQVAALGGSFIEAASGAEALDLARQRKPDLITLDLLMPRMHGSEVLRALQEDTELCTIPVVVVTSFAHDAPGLVGALSLLPKPLTAEDLRDAFRQSGGLGRVLVVDDDPDSRALLSSYAYEEGASEVFVAADGDTALSLLESVQPDLVLLDLVLPKQTGAEILARMAEAGDHKFAVLIVTSKELSAGEARALQLNSIGLLHKGERLEEELRSAFRLFAANRSARHAAGG